MPLPYPPMSRARWPSPARLHLLPLALAASLPATAAPWQGPIVVVAGERRSFDNERIDLDVPGTALHVRGAGSLAELHSSDIRITTPTGSAVRIDDGGRAIFNAGNITLDAGSALSVNGSGSSLNADGLRISGGRSTGGGMVGVRNGAQADLTATSLTGSGLLLSAQDQDSRLSLADGRLDASGPARIEAGSGALLELRGLGIDLAGSGHDLFSGMLINNGARLMLDQVDYANGMISLLGASQASLQDSQARNAAVMLMGSSDQLSTLRLQNSLLQSSGTYAVNVNDRGQLIAHGSTIISAPGTAGSAIWLSSDSSRADLQDSTLDVDGTQQHGVQVFGGIASLRDSTVIVRGEAASAVRATGSTSSTRTTARLDGTHLQLLGHASNGVFFGGGTTHARLDRVRIDGAAASSTGVIQVNGATLEGSDGLDISLGGRQSTGWRAYYNAAGNYRSAAVLENAQIDIRDGSALLLQGNEHQLTLRNSAINQRAGGSDLLQVRDTRFSNGSSVATGKVELTAHGSRLDGDVRVDSDSAALQMRLLDNSHWQGALHGTAERHAALLDVAPGSQWSLPGDSAVGELQHGGSIAFVPPTAADFHELHVYGPYIGNDGLLLLNTQLGTDDAPSDRLHIHGDSSGSARIAVRNAGGSGGATLEGLPVVRVDGRSDAVFTLQGRAVAGAYDYFLHQGASSRPDDGNWYLRSALNDEGGGSGGGETPDPGGDKGPPVAPPGVLRPEAGVWAANLSAALSLFDLTLLERGGGATLDRGGHGQGNQQDSDWVRDWQRNTRGPLDPQLDYHSQQQVQQLGSELLSWGDNARSSTGLMFGRVRSQQQVRSSLSGFSAQGRVRGHSVGAFATWRQDGADRNGLYIDSWVQATRLHSRVQGQTLPAEHSRSRGLFAAVEAGRSLLLHQSADSALYLQPQLQLLYAQLHQDQHQEDNGTLVQIRTQRQLRSRVGLRLYSRSLRNSGARVQPYAAYDWTRRHGGAAAVWMDDTRIDSAQPRDVQRLRTGMQAQLTARLSGWGELQLERGSGGQRGKAALIGMRYRW